MDINFLNDWSRRVFASGQMLNSDVISLRRHAEAHDADFDGVAIADALMDIDAKSPGAAAEWSAFFTETLVDLLVWGERPTGAITPATADWLLARVKIEGGRAVGSHRALLVAFVREAQTCDPRLSAIAFGYATTKAEQMLAAPMRMGWPDSSRLAV